MGCDDAAGVGLQGRLWGLRFSRGTQLSRSRSRSPSRRPSTSPPTSRTHGSADRPGGSAAPRVAPSVVPSDRRAAVPPRSSFFATHGVERGRRARTTVAVAHPPKRQLQTCILLRPARLTHDVRQRLVLPLPVQEASHALQAVECRCGTGWWDLRRAGSGAACRSRRPRPSSGRPR